MPQPVVVRPLEHDAVGLHLVHDTGDDGMMIPEVLAIPASESPADPAAAPDLDAAAGVVEVELEAKVSQIEIAPGRTLSMWTYNGQLPGPRIEAYADETVRVVGSRTTS